MAGPTTPKNDAEALRLLESADLSTESGREQAEAVIEWAEGRSRLPRDLRVALTDAHATMRRGSISRGVTEPGEYNRERLLAVSNAIGRAIKRALTAPSDGGTSSGGLDLDTLTNEAWPHMTADERDAVSRSGHGPGSIARPSTTGPTRGQEADAARLAGQAAAGTGAPRVDTTGGEDEARWRQRGRADDSGREAQIATMVESMIADGMDPTEARALAESMVGHGDVDNPLLGVPEGHVATRSLPDLPADLQVDADRWTGLAREHGAEPHAAQYRASDTEEPFGWDAARISRLQDSLVKAGLLRGEFRRGWYDEATGEAYARALGLANQRGMNIVVALDSLADARDQEKADAIAAFAPPERLPPDPTSLRGKARASMLSIGRRSADIDESELDELVSVLSGEFKRAHRMEVDFARRQHEAEVEAAFGGTPQRVDTAGLVDSDPIARFEEQFHQRFAGEIETRETGAEVARRGQGFDRGMASARGQVRGGGA